MSRLWTGLFDTSEFLSPWGQGSGWNWQLGATHIIADLAIWLAFLALPAMLLFFAIRGRHVRLSRVWWLFVGFLVVGSLVHLLDAVAFAWPAYRLIALAKVTMAVVAWTTVALLFQLFPRLLEAKSVDEFRAQILRREQAEQALLASEAAYRLLIDSLPLNVFRKDLEGRFVLVNQRFCESLGKPSDGILGKTDFDIFPAHQARQYRRDDEHLLASGEVFEKVEAFYRQDGEKLHIHTLKAPMLDAEGKVVGIQGMFWDVTNQIRADEAVRQIDARFRKLVESNLIGVVVAYLDGRLIDANDAFLQIVGYSREDIVEGRVNNEMLTPPEYAEEDQQAADKTRALGSCERFEKELIHRNGSRVPVLVGITLLDEAAEECICFVLDITRQKQTERELKAAKTAADAANEAKSQFLANMSHEVRTPMNAIIGMTELVLRSPLPAKQAEYLKMVLQSSESLLQVINDVLDFSKVESGKIDLEEAPMSLRECLGDALRTLALRAHDKGLELALDVAPDVPDWIWADCGRLRQVVVNLVGNAIKFTHEGEVVAEIRRRAGDETHVDLQFSIRDTGIGIAADKLTKIFEPFEQADKSTTRQYGGTGLGLAIVRRMIEMMEGRVWAESQPGKGSQFHFTARFELASPPEDDNKSPRRNAVRGTRVLVVDSSDTNRRIFAEMLRQWELVPTTCDGADKALELLREAWQRGMPYELVIADRNLKRVDGLRLVESIRNDASLQETRIILLSSAERPEDTSRCEQLHIDHRLLKPVKQSELFNAVVAALKLFPPEPEREETAAGELTPARSLRILLAEDSIVNQRLASALLERHGHELVIANNGNETLGAWECEPFDLILMDVQMPELDGLETTRRIREMERQTGQHIPIIAMTAHALKGDRERCLEAGMDEYVAKPVRERNLLSAMRAVLGDGVAVGSDGADDVSPTDPAPAGPVDWDAALKFCEGDPALLHDIVEAFLEEYPQRLDDVRRAIANHDSELLHRSAHTIKGSMRYFGAQRAFDRAYALERMGNERRFDGIDDRLAELQQEMAQLLPVLTDYIHGRGGRGA